MKFCAVVLLRCLIHQCLFTENSRGTLKNREYCESFAQRIFPHLQYSIKSKQTRCIKQVDILISKNQALQILYLKHIKLHKLATMDRNPRKFNPHKQYCTVLLLYYNSKQNIPYNWPTEQILTRIFSRFLISYALFN